MPARRCTNVAASSCSLDFLLRLGSSSRGDQFAADVWHHPLIAAVVDQRFLVIDRKAPGENLELADLAEPVSSALGSVACRVTT